MCKTRKTGVILLIICCLLVVDTTTGTSTTDGSTGTSTTEESTGSPTPEESTGTPTPEESTGTPTPEESTGTPTPEESTGTPTPEESTGTPTPEETTGTPTTDGTTIDYRNVQFNVTLDGDSNLIKDEQEDFKTSFIKQFAEQLNINETSILIIYVREGSIIVGFNVTEDDETRKGVCEDLFDLIKDRNLFIIYKSEKMNATNVEGLCVPGPSTTIAPQPPTTNKPTNPYPFELNQTELIIICIAGVICLLLLILGIIVCCRECKKNKKTLAMNDADGYYRQVSLEEFRAIPRPHVTYDTNGHDEFEMRSSPGQMESGKLIGKRDNISGGVDNPVFRNSQINEPKTTF